MAFVGEGDSPTGFGALYADVVFAKDALVGWCERDGVPYVPWTDFDDVRARLESTGRPARPRLAAALSRVDRTLNAMHPIDLPDGLRRRDRRRPTTSRRRSDSSPLPSHTTTERPRSPGATSRPNGSDRTSTSRRCRSPSGAGEELAASGDVFMGRAEVDVAPAHRGRGLGSALLSVDVGRRASRRQGLRRADGVGQAHRRRGPVRRARRTRSATPRGRCASISTTSRRRRRPCLRGSRSATSAPTRTIAAVFEVIDVAFDEWDRSASRTASTTGRRRSCTATRSYPGSCRSWSTATASWAWHSTTTTGSTTTWKVGPSSSPSTASIEAGDSVARLLQESFRRFHGVGYRRAAASPPTRARARSGSTSTSACACDRASRGTRSSSPTS